MPLPEWIRSRRSLQHAADRDRLYVHGRRAELDLREDHAKLERRRSEQHRRLARIQTTILRVTTAHICSQTRSHSGELLKLGLYGRSVDRRQVHRLDGRQLAECKRLDKMAEMNPTQFWIQLREQWQKAWADAMAF